MENKDKNYSTSDLALAALLSLNFPLKGVTPLTTSKVVFHFSLTDDLQECIDKYLHRQCVVEPQTYFSQLKWVKTQVYSVLRGDQL